MDAAYKVHARIGQHEFDGEGPLEIVKADYQQFLVIIANRADKDSPRTEQQRAGNGAGTKDDTEVDQEILTQIFKFGRR